MNKICCFKYCIACVSLKLIKANPKKFPLGNSYEKQKIPSSYILYYFEKEY